MFRTFSFLFSLVLLVFAQPDISPLFCLFGSILGYGFLWYSLGSSGKQLSTKLIFALSFLWSFTIEGIHFSWMLSDVCVGKIIYVVWFALCTILATLFSVFSCLIIFCVRKNHTRILWAIPGLWVLVEMFRFYGLFSGMSLDYLGWPISATAYGRQFGGFLGWAGQSYVVMATGISWYLSLLRKNSAKYLWSFFSCLPYLLGGVYYEYVNYHFHDDPTMRVAVVQTGISPQNGSQVSAMQIWKHVLHLSSQITMPVDLIVFPEVSFPCGINKRIIPVNEVNKILPDLTNSSGGEGYLTNFDLVHMLAQRFSCSVLVGLERWEPTDRGVYLYNAAECVSPTGVVVGYDKQILVPGGEYIPCGKLGWAVCKKYFPEYALACQRIPGSRSGVLEVEGITKVGVSICYEETFGSLLRRYKIAGARLLVNLTNDGWYPRSRLPQVHFFHGILRNQELGMPCVRACHTGTTAVVDSLGRILKALPCETKQQQPIPGILQVLLPLYNYKTPYTFWGDLPMVLLGIISLVWIVIYFGYHLLAKKEKG
ncbi:apolipoprotein N-acyltransferase [Chlamydia ibidis]|uniref:Apolipoprotein N-acyltransferase n=2 Tax=Chlamydia ibidis TaxID=1405396 RepID=S7J3R2_9CHLA|nr:apolipoprotein N-acyltransferase [Chlamydia ibidis]EPP34853.1 apolipoprotein N-acyltransferase [Chlamydia ibidis]EQM63185.1 apolipoprotein N-acyltransferase [Chlamydia ibidis 10-1398/6]